MGNRGTKLLQLVRLDMNKKARKQEDGEVTLNSGGLGTCQYNASFAPNLLGDP